MAGMPETLVLLLTAHLLGDFVLQTEGMVERKAHPGVLLLHVLLVAGAVVVLLGSAPWPILLAILLTHAAMDAVKVHLLPQRTSTFVFDQVVHIAVIAILAAIYPTAAGDGLWLTRLSAEAQRWYLTGVTGLAGLLLCVPVGGVLIGKLTEPFVREIRQDRRPGLGPRRVDAGRRENDGDDRTSDHPDGDLEGLRHGGRYIGWLERSLVMLLLLIGQPTGIGFLFAAKSILRFGEVKDSHQRKIAEYIIIGTFLSFGWALLISYLTQQAIARI